MHGGGAGTLLVFGVQRTLFTEDDIAVLTDLGRQATVLADRAVLTGQLTSTVDALRAANEAKNDFVAAMSHELRTPLNAIIGFSELMGLEEMIADRRLVPDEWINNVHSSGRHLLGLINDVLDLAKVEAGRIDLRLEPLDVGTAVAEAVAPLSPLVTAKQLRLTLAAPPELVTADRMRLRQMLNNLLSNAIKFTPPNGSIYVSAHREGAETHLSVADTGPGIDPADQHRVFDEFHQTGDAESRAAGTGLGLALTRRLAEVHGGRVELWSEPGRGSRFTLVLPAAEYVGEPVDAGPVAATAAAPGEDRVGILLIEDDASAASLLRTYLTGAGYTVHVASSGEAGIEYAARCVPQLILLDVLLPGMDGWSVLEKLKADERLRHIPVVVVTVVDEREVGLALGAVDYFVKPIERGALLSLVERHGVDLDVAVPPGILVVDPDPDSLAGIESRLREWGHRVTPALSAAEAFALTRGHRFDLIMFDADLSGPAGEPMLDALRAEPAAAGTPVVVLTSGEITAADGYLAGLIGSGGPVLGVISRTDLRSEHLRRWLGVDMTPAQIIDTEPALA
jgi:signal transduction histidine kinase/CheY-like chemotaxis protein